MEKKSINGANAIYYFEEKIAENLPEFIRKFDKEPTYFEAE